MKLNKKIFALVLCLIGLVANVNAQSVKSVSAEYVYVQPENETLAQAKAKAIQKAKVQALADEFGTLIEQSNFTNTREGNFSFVSMGMSEVRGEWLGDTKEPEFTYAMNDIGLRVITVKVWGKAREIVSAGIDVDAKLLKNGIEARYEDDEFKEGDEYYISFRSPVDGYLTIYMMDEGDNAMRLLPYSNSHEMSYRIVADKDYLFFSRKNLNDGDDANTVDEYILYAAKPVEYNRVYIIFSPNEFVHPKDSQSGSINANGVKLKLPRVLSFNDMQEWLLKNRSRDKQMQVVRKEIVIRK